MSILRPKTIIVSAQPFRPIQAAVTCSRPNSVVIGRNLESSLTSTTMDLDSLLDDRLTSDDDVSVCDGAPRKRRRLNYLSAEEKLVRRKLKNRVAAQTARDRKKQHMAELEETLAIVQAENQALATENDTLRRSADALLKENAELKQRLSTSTQQPLVTRNPSDAEAKPAVLSTPLQQEQVRTVFQLTARCIMVTAMFLSLIPGLKCSGSAKAHSKRSKRALTSRAQTAATGCWRRKSKRQLPRESWDPPWKKFLLSSM